MYLPLHDPRQDTHHDKIELIRNNLSIEHLDDDKSINSPSDLGSPVKLEENLEIHVKTN